MAVAKALGDRSIGATATHTFRLMRRCRAWWISAAGARGGTQYRGARREFDVDLTHEFFQGFVKTTRRRPYTSTTCEATTRITSADGLQGVRARRAWRSEPDARSAGLIPSTKGTL